MNKMHMGDVEVGSSLRYLRLTRDSFSPGLFAGTEGLKIFVQYNKIKYPVTIVSINFNSKVVKTTGALNIKLNDHFKIYHERNK